MMVVVFRNRLRPGVEQEYGEHANRIYDLALKMPGLVSSKDFTAEDGERLTVIEFRSAEELEAWRAQSEHLAAQERGRQHYFSEYSLQVCELVRESRFPR
ncbi:MAG TPA: antibiotic biosynthesis monooxygenase [Polyangiaceae bacterium]|nr:antibiotic biosynthesis monooxygenase [Polyangiaceae bacterium]